MNKLLEAIETKRIYNAMPFDEFINEYEKHYDIVVPEDIKDNFRFTGLTNVCFITSEFILHELIRKDR